MKTSKTVVAVLFLFAAAMVSVAVRAEPLFVSAPADAARGGCETLVVARAVTNLMEVARAVWHTTGLGVYEAYVNGCVDGRFALKPGFTHARRRRQEFAWVSGSPVDAGGLNRVYFTTLRVGIVAQLDRATVS